MIINIVLSFLKFNLVARRYLENYVLNMLHLQIWKTNPRVCHRKDLVF